MMERKDIFLRTIFFTVLAAHSVKITCFIFGDFTKHLT
jgi:hypothetical protein